MWPVTAASIAELLEGPGGPHRDMRWKVLCHSLATPDMLGLSLQEGNSDGRNYF